MPKKDSPPAGLRDSAKCKVVGGTHAGKSGTVRDINTSKTGHLTITVVQANRERPKTLARNVTVGWRQPRSRNDPNSGSNNRRCVRTTAPSVWPAMKSQIRRARPSWVFSASIRRLTFAGKMRMTRSLRSA